MWFTLLHVLGYFEYIIPVVYAISQVAEGCRLRGVSRIIGIDLNPDKFELGTN